MAINVLIVLDGDYRFRDGAVPAGAPDFTYATLVDALVAAGMNVTTAHRQLDSTALQPSFVFSGASINTALYDVAWLIGLQGRNAAPGSTSASGANAILPSELKAIAQYMADGGGVFATGDHDSIGSDMCGLIPRVRAMRAWFGTGDSFASIPAGLPRNNPRSTGARADTTRRNPAGSYTPIPMANPHVWFENQSDSVPQPIAPIADPAHPILRHNNGNVLVFPDHMHEGKCLGEVGTYTYSQTLPIDGQDFTEFPLIAGHRELPEIIATGTTQPFSSRSAVTTGLVEGDAISDPASVDIMSVYDGRVAGVGRVVTGSTFHHYVDINLTGDEDVVVGPIQDRTGPDAANNVGFNANSAVFDQIKAVFVNIATWLARPRPSIQLVLERSTFSKDEAVAAPSNTFTGVVLVTVDGLKPNQFPGGGLAAGLSVAEIRARGPQIAVTDASAVHVEAIAVDTDDDFANDRLQRITFTYHVRFSNVNGTFDPIGMFEHKQVDATLTNPGVLPAPLTDRAWITLVAGANPFMLDLDGGNQTTWLSSDIKVFRVRQGQGLPAVPAVASLPANPNRSHALTFIRNIVSNITPAQFESLTGDQAASTLSSMPLTTGGQRVFNFAIARVRLNNAAASAADVRLFFRMFTTQTTAALTYRESSPGVPIEGYVQTAGANPIALPGQNAGGTEWLSFPFFSATRAATPAVQTDTDNVGDIPPGQADTFFGVLLDNNLDDPYPGLNPGPGMQPTLRDLLTGEHQCLVAQIEFNGAPIPNGATPWTSDKLSQRNLAVSQVANPGLDASRVAMHTFEIEATPGPITDQLRPDELLLDWSERTPAGTVLRIHIPSWRAQDVIELANRVYARHEIEAVDEHTIELPGGGTRYVPIPRSLLRQTGVIAAEFPLGIEKGQRFDVSVRQITNRHRRADIPPPKVKEISREEAKQLLARAPGAAGRAAAAAIPKGAFELGENRVLLTDLSLLDLHGDYALIIENPEPAVVAAAMQDSGVWRETIGAFQLGVPVSTKGGMRLDHMRLLSVMRWRLAQLPRGSRWRRTMAYYVDLLTAKVQALGGNPWDVPATSDGAIPQLPWVKRDPDHDGADGEDGSGANDDPLERLVRTLAYPWGCLLLALLLLLVIWVVVRS